MAVAAAVLLTAGSGELHQASAAPKITVQTLYYSVRGSSSRELLRYMLQNGPHASGGRALGTTSAKISQSMELTERRNRCALTKYKVTMDITLRLPKLARGQKLRPAVRATFNRFADYVRKHENRHKTIFASCARQIERRVRALSRNQSCESLRTRMRAVFTEENRACDRRHAAFDAEESKRVHRLPFIRQAAKARQQAKPRKAQSQTTRTKAFQGRD